jgi:hypothetical protein
MLISVEYGVEAQGLYKKSIPNSITLLDADIPAATLGTDFINPCMQIQ